VRHIAIVGPGGAGKSRLARELGEAVGVPVVHLDRLFWKPGWVAPPPAEWEAVQKRELDRESWIADGLQEGTEYLWLDAADTIVFLDASPLSCVWRVTRRRLVSRDGPETPVDCEPAPAYRAFLKFLRYLWRYRRTTRAEIVADLSRREDRQQVIVLRRDTDLRAFLADVPRRDPAA
jgi:adenylate kinase family enzyme